ncbi:hypothetical protein SGPA1_30320 [Streptomyces misionensis JCM 4497]
MRRPAGEGGRPVGARAGQRRCPGHPRAVLAAGPAVRRELDAGQGRRAALARRGRHLRPGGQRRRRQLSRPTPSAVRAPHRVFGAAPGRFCPSSQRSTYPLIVQGANSTGAFE